MEIVMLFTKVWNVLTIIFEAIQKAQEARASVAILQSMSDKELRDMGITSHEIYEVVAGKFNKA
jgi:uncharacterized protein YjiS (DUF1127 family)